MKTLTEEQATALTAFLECFDLHTTGVWAVLMEAMREEWGIEDPEAALEDARGALQA
jgi:hypothetical protein